MATPKTPTVLLGNHMATWNTHSATPDTHGASRDTHPHLGLHGATSGTHGHPRDILAFLGSTASTPPPMGVRIPMVKPQHGPPPLGTHLVTNRDIRE
jgi:hypothetical protein